ncbi:hypothetical protein HGM15179_011157 [Zosterops borbonicus]|uniref:Uncharacterized protein n=1 Tax=Zosterops borbonicus TaxID=364589 RepID=A0A8K1GCZ5_9PASS|nr:hypothetical protein HGM15179_011157 [Zosterops borbonicus]
MSELDHTADKDPQGVKRQLCPPTFGVHQPGNCDMWSLEQQHAAAGEHREAQPKLPSSETRKCSKGIWRHIVKKKLKIEAVSSREAYGHFGKCDVPVVGTWSDRNTSGQEEVVSGAVGTRQNSLRMHGDVVWFMYQELNSISDFEESDQTFKLAEEREVIRGTVKSTLFYSHLRSLEKESS